MDKGALVLDTATDEVYFSADKEAYKHAYVTVFQAWAKGTIKGTAVFEATKSVLEDQPTKTERGVRTCRAWHNGSPSHLPTLYSSQTVSRAAGSLYLLHQPDPGGNSMHSLAHTSRAAVPLR